MKRGQAVERTPAAKDILIANGFEWAAKLTGVYTGKSRGALAGFDLVRVGSNPKAEPFEPGMWQPVSPAPEAGTAPVPAGKE